MEVSLREWKRGDGEAKSRFTNNPNVLRWLWDGVPDPYTVEAADEWIERVLAFPADKGKEYAITVENQIIGTIGYTIGESMKRYSCEVGYFIDEEYWGKGIATQALRQVEENIWKHTDCVRIFAEVYAGNRASGRVLEKNGFTKEAVLKKAVVKNGKMLDLEIYAKIRS